MVSESIELSYCLITLPEGIRIENDVLIQPFISVERVTVTLCCMYMRNILSHVPACRSVFMGSYKVVNLRCPLTLPFMNQCETINLQMFIILIPGL